MALQGTGVTLAVLFGSRATGRATAASDWDLGVQAPREVDLLRLSAELGVVMKGRVDVVNLLDA
jgi:predicted nucleotidyltransferase